MNDRALLVWSPTNDIADNKLEEYIAVAKEKYGYNGEQALGMLFWHKHDLERAVLDLANFTPFPDEWTDEDKVLFEQAFQFHGKNFHRIRQMVRHEAWDCASSMSFVSKFPLLVIRAFSCLIKPSPALSSTTTHGRKRVAERASWIARKRWNWRKAPRMAARTVATKTQMPKRRWDIEQIFVLNASNLLLICESSHTFSYEARYILSNW